MIELPIQRLEGGLQIGKVANPANRFVDFSADVNLHAKGMAMQPGASVAGWNIRQPVRCLKAEFFEYLHHSQV
jgi:hypothetical protein